MELGSVASVCTHSRPMEMRCCPIRRTISWSVCAMRRPGGGCRSPFVACPSPFTWCGGAAPLEHGWCMASGWAGGDSLRDRLRGGRWPAPSSPESLEARLAPSPPPARRARRSAEITSAPSASASTPPPPCDVTAACNHCSRSIHHLSLFVLDDTMSSRSDYLKTPKSSVDNLLSSKVICTAAGPYELRIKLQC